MRCSADSLVARYRQIHEERFRGLPIVNPALEVEAVGMRKLGAHEFGVLITPWFMNLVLLPASDRWDARPQGSVCAVELPGGRIEFTIGHDDVAGTLLSAALFSSVADFPDQGLARDIARETLRLLFSQASARPAGGGDRMTRRDLLRRLGDAGQERR